MDCMEFADCTDGMNSADCTDCTDCMNCMNSADCADCMDCEYGARLECGREGAKAPKARRAPEPAARASVRGRRRALGRKKDRRLKAMACSCGIWLSVHLNEREHSAHLSYPKNSRERCLLKRVTNKRVRKKLDVPGFAGYRRVLDFWWMLD